MTKNVGYNSLSKFIRKKRNCQLCFIHNWGNNRDNDFEKKLHTAIVNIRLFAFIVNNVAVP